MKQGIHPQTARTTITCSCGESIEVQSTKESMRVEVCSRCHPFFTGNRQRSFSIDGRVEKFKKKYGLTE